MLCRGVWERAILILALGSGCIGNTADGAERPAYGSTNIWKIHLEITGKEYDAMQPRGEGFGGPGIPASPRANRPREPREFETNLFGTQFPWAEAQITLNGSALGKARVRYAGDITYFASSASLKRPLKLDLSRVEGAEEMGLSSLHLHSMPLDPTKARECLSLAVLRDAQVPAPHTAFAEVSLSVPGRFDRTYLGLYLVIEDVDRRFLTRQFGDGSGLLLRPARMRGIDFLGIDWSQYAASYRPAGDVKPNDTRRVIELARLVNQGTDTDFHAKIADLIDVESFLRFTAASALLANLESFHALGHNYSLYLNPKTQKFVFLPGDLEFTFGNFLLMGQPEQLMDLNVYHPYPGENRLPDRLLAIPEYRRRYQEILRELVDKVFTKERLSREIDKIEETTRKIREREAEAAAARREPPTGFGPPGAPAPQPPDLKTFVMRRLESVAAQLDGRRQGYIPQFAMGATASRPQAITEAQFRQEVSVPEGFEVTLFGAPPRIHSPVAIAAAPSGEIYVAVDQQGSLGRTPQGGKILRCLDQNGDGKVDSVTEFARVDHPRGVLYRGGNVWVMHPPTLSLFRDENGDGVADRHEVLVTGLTTEMIDIRGGDHTTNGIRMGIDGWIYIGVGDYGIKEAKGKDGRTISLRGGGIVRVRPDGTELEIFCTGLRNPFDIGIDPFLNLFTRDNTNDGAGWDTRIMHLIQTANYGYTQLFANFTDETMPPLGTFGGGGGTGALVIRDPRWPAEYNTLLTGDWGRSEVYRHSLKPHGATFDLSQDVFVRIPRATGMDLDADGRLYLASWRGGEASVDVGPNVGFVACVTPKGLSRTPFPDLRSLPSADLVRLLASPQFVTRQHVQWEILRRGALPEIRDALEALVQDNAAAQECRVAALWTIKQLLGKDAQARLVQWTNDPMLRESALRALTDRLGEIGELDAQVFIACLNDESPRVQAQAIISLSRLGNLAAAPHLLPLTARPAGSVMPTRRPVQNQPDPDRVIPHLAVNALVSLRAIDACLAALDGPHAAGALAALRRIHDLRTVEGLVKKLSTVHDAGLRRGILTALIRLYHREADYDGSWWGIRPDSTGPYYEPVEWAGSKRIASVITAAVQETDADQRAFLRDQLTRHQVELAGVVLSPGATAADEKPIVLPPVDPNNPELIGNQTYEAVLQKTLSAKGDPIRGRELFRAQSCVNCHTDADGQTPKGPHLVDIGKRYQAAELIESILKPSEKIAQGYESYRFSTHDGKDYTGFIVSERADTILIRESSGVQRILKKAEVETREPQRPSIMPEGLVGNLTPQQLADLIAYLQSLQ